MGILRRVALVVALGVAAPATAFADEEPVAPPPTQPPPPEEPAPAAPAPAPAAPDRAAAPTTPDRHGPSVAVSGGANVVHPYVGVNAGYRFARADFVEVFVDWSYDAAISTFPFHTFGAGARTFFATLGPVEIYHQALFGFALSGGGTASEPSRDLGERLLGAFTTQGVGAEVRVVQGLRLALTASTGYPVWFRPELAARWRF